MRAQLLIALFPLLLAACSIAPKHATLQSMDLPQLIPVRDFVANTDHTDGFSLSPDGQWLAYQGVSQLRPAILWRGIESSSKLLAVRFKKNAPWPFWAADSRHILYGSDDSGRENYHVYSIDTRHPDKPPRDLTPHPNTRAYVVQVPSKASSVIHVMHNRRDASIFDLYQINLETGQEKLLYQNSDNVLSLLVDDSGAVRARLRQEDTSRLIEVPEGSNWKTLLSATVFDNLYPLALTESGDALHVISNVDRDKRALIRVDLSSGEQTMVLEDDRVDLGSVWMSPRDKRPLFAHVEPNYPELLFLDAGFERVLKPFHKPGINGVSLMSLDRAENMATAVVYDHTGAEYKLLDLDTGESQSLGQSPSRKHQSSWVEKTPFEFDASDGMRLHGYSINTPANGLACAWWSLGSRRVGIRRHDAVSEQSRLRRLAGELSRLDWIRS